MDEELEALKPTKLPATNKPIELERWNIEDLNAYKERLNAEIARINVALAGKDNVKSAADNLFKK